jgi:hypothetical protein
MISITSKNILSRSFWGKNGDERIMFTYLKYHRPFYSLDWDILSANMSSVLFLYFFQAVKTT